MKKKGWIKGMYHNDISGNNSDKAYRVWTAIIRRCTGVSNAQKCYEGTVVCNEWHIFSVFKAWYDSQQCSERWQIDKDFLHKGGSKVYSPSTCVMLPGYVNTIVGFQSNEFSKGVRGVTAIYESVKGKGTLYVACVSEFRRDGKTRIVKTRGKDPRELHHWYQEEKARQIEACRDHYAHEEHADTRVLERLTEIAWKLRVDRMDGVITERV